MTASAQKRQARIAYGKGRIPLELDPRQAEWRVIEPRPEAPLADPRAEFEKAARNPIGARPMREVVRPGERVVIVTSDGTRPVPNRLLIPWILEELSLDPEDVTILLGTGTHRPNTKEEIAAIFGEGLAGALNIVNHDAYDEENNLSVGRTRRGGDARLDRAYLEADRRIAVGFIEPHFFAGFSGGAKGVAPGVAGIETILRLHDFEMVGHEKSVWGELEGNPIQEEVQEIVAMAPPDFLVNVTLNANKEITGFYLGDYFEAHRAGCRRVKETAMAAVPRRYPIVVTSNSGFPLDQNLYQAVKGMSAAARIAEQGGTIFIASECSDGIPAHGNFGAMLREGGTPDALLAHIRGLRAPKLDQWQAQILAELLKRCEIALFSSLARETAEAAMVRPVENLERAVADEIRRRGPGAAVAVLPEGPLTIPYVA